MKTYVTYGFFSALAGLLLTLILFFLGYHSDPDKLGTANTIGTVGGIAISVAFIVLGTKAKRSEVPLSEPFGYGRALGAGVMVALFAALFGALGYSLYASFINPGLLDLSFQAQTAKMEEAGMTSEQIASAERVIRVMMHPAIQGALAFVMSALFGTLIALITSAFLKRPASEPPLVA